MLTYADVCRPDERVRIESMGGIVGMVNPNQFPMAVLRYASNASLTATSALKV